MTDVKRLVNVGFVNVFLVKTTDGYVLIDTGMAQRWARLESDLLQIGCLPANLKLVLITHGDPDHAGNCAELQRKYGVKVGMHSGDVAMVKSGVLVKRQIRSVREQVVQWLAERMGMKKFKRFEPDLLLEDDQGLGVYGFSAKVLCTPGHTKGSIAILTDDGHLFVGDTLANTRKLERTPVIQNEQELQDSVAKLKLTKAQMVYPGHGKPFRFEALSSIT